MDSDLLLNLITDICMLFQENLRIFTSLSDLISVICVPCTALIYNSAFRCQIKNISLFGNAGSEHNIKFCLFKRRSHLILHNFDSGVVSHHLTALFQCLYSADIHADRWIKFQSTPTCRCLRVSKHNSNLLTQLIDKDNYTIRFTDHCCKFTESLWHQSGLKTYMAVTHISINLRLRYKCGNRVNDHNIHSSGTHHRLCDLKCLFSIVRLWYVQVIDIYTDILCIDRIQSMFCINKSGNPASFLHFRNHVKCNGCLTAGFRSVNLDDTSLGNTTYSKCNIKT